MSYKTRVRDRKPRGRGLGMPHGTAAQQADVVHRKAAVLADRVGTPAQTAEIIWDRTPNGRKSGLVFTRYTGGRLSTSPATDVAYWLRAKLNGTRHRRPDCTVYDAQGKAVAVIDGETRERRPL